MTRPFDTVVSLGQSCETAWNLRRRQLLHPERLPFDWSQTTQTALCSVLQDRFHSVLTAKDARVSFYVSEYAFGHVRLSELGGAVQHLQTLVDRLTALTPQRVLFVRTTYEVARLETDRQEILSALAAFGFQECELVQFVKGLCPAEETVFPATGSPDTDEAWQGCQADWDRFAAWLREQYGRG